MIVFRTIRWKNFLSTGNAWISVQLDKHPLTLIVGENGAGKSTLLDAICFVLFGKPFRNINKPQLTNSINKKDLLVEIEFSIGEKNYKVRRGDKPTLFEVYINDVLVDQVDNRDYQKAFEKDILRLNYKSFVQIVTLGVASFVPFMRLPTGDRRALIDSLLDVEVFTQMAAILKQRLQQNTNETRAADHQIELLEQRIVYLNRHITAMEVNREGLIQQHEERIETLKKEREEIVKPLAGYQAQVTALVASMSEEPKTKKDYNVGVHLQQQLKQRREKIKANRAFFETNPTCPTCTQNIEQNHKEGVIKKYDQQEKKVADGMAELDQKIADGEKRLGEFAEIARQIQQTQAWIDAINSETRMREQLISSIEKEMKELRGAVDEAKNEREDLEKASVDLVSVRKQRDLLLEQRNIYSLAQLLLKDDGIKTTIVKKYIPIINKLVGKYLAALDFFVNFELDENFKERILSRYRDEFSYDSFSEGEKLRIDLALLFTWRAVSKMRNSASTNLLIMDEIFESSLDSVGVEDFLKLLNTFSETANVFIISHRGDALFDKFDNVLRFEKIQNFTTVKEK